MRSPSKSPSGSRTPDAHARPVAGCNPGWYGHTYHGSRTVWLCGSFWSAPMTGTDSKFGTLVHERSHAKCSTEYFAEHL
ncbi:hypothetical protein GTW71_25130 [Streptomyces sp. SID6041]|nr:hypothetical protein [Streptomyces sp. SID6041]